jgi:hypothetical protein
VLGEIYRSRAKRQSQVLYSIVDLVCAYHLSQLLNVAQIETLCAIVKGQPGKTMIPGLVIAEEPPLLEELVRKIVLYRAIAHR